LKPCGYVTLLVTSSVCRRCWWLALEPVELVLKIGASGLIASSISIDHVSTSSSTLDHSQAFAAIAFCGASDRRARIRGTAFSAHHIAAHPAHVLVPT